MTEMKNLGEAPAASGSLTSNDKILVEVGGSIRRMSVQAITGAIGDAARLGTGYAVCSTAAGTAAKTVSISDFVLLKNAMVSVLFNNGFTVGACTLNVSSTGAKPIFLHGAAVKAGDINSKTVAMLQYDGTNWNIVSRESYGRAVGELVDMGLPSGLLWAKCNIGANAPEGYGHYFSWGNTDAHAEGSGYNFSQDVYDATPAAAITANLSLSQDAARANLGAPWRMPTSAEFQELYDNCTCVWTTLNGVNGRLFTSNVNGNTLFLPAAGLYDGTSLGGRGSSGFYWSSACYSATGARGLGFHSSSVGPQYIDVRRYGFSVRAVQ